MKAYSYSDVVQLNFHYSCLKDFVTLSKREPALVDNDGDNSDDGNEGDEDDDNEIDEDQEVIIAAKHPRERGKEMIMSCAVELRQ